MKILNSAQVSPFGGLNFVIEEFERLNLNLILKEYLPPLSPNCKYHWKDILYSFWSIYFCGGDCIEDIGLNLKTHLLDNPYFKTPSPDRILDRLKELTNKKTVHKAPRGLASHEFGINDNLNKLNLSLLSRLGSINQNNLTLDYDNTIIYNEKADSKMTYKKEFGYQPGVALVGSNVVYLENRNGNSNPRTLQDETMNRMFELLKDHNISVTNFRADSGSYLYGVIEAVERHTTNFYIKSRMSATIAEAIKKVKKWELVQNSEEEMYRAEIEFTPFKRALRDRKMKDKLKSYRLIISKVKRKDGQINAFTQEACIYSAIAINDMIKSKDEIVTFYNQRGTIEKEFDILKNDFGWRKLSFSKLEQNTVYLILTAICKNLYTYIIQLFSKKYKGLNSKFRIKKFIFRFITIPAKWIKTARKFKLRIYGEIEMKT